MVYDVVFMDIELPGMNGMEAARRMRRLDQKVVRQSGYMRILLSFCICGGGILCYNRRSLTAFLLQSSVVTPDAIVEQWTAERAHP